MIVFVARENALLAWGNLTPTSEQVSAQQPLHDKHLDLERLQASSKAQASLAAAYADNGETLVYCLCSPGNYLRLHIRHAHGKYSLCRHKETGPDHLLSCSKFGRTCRRVDQDKDGYCSVKEGEDGIWDCKLARPLFPKVKKAASGGNGKARRRGTRPTKATPRGIGLVRQLQILYVLSGHNGTVLAQVTVCWDDVQRDLSRVRCKVRIDGQPGDHTILVSGSPDFKALNRAELLQSGEQRIVIGEVAKFGSKSKRDDLVWLVSGGAPILVNANMGKRARTECNFPCPNDVMDSLGNPGNRFAVIAIGRVSPSPKGGLRFHELRLIVVTRNFIPAESRLEGALIDWLVEAQREFAKPLFRRPGDLVVPDVVLHDTVGPTPMEVRGMMRLPEYAERDEMKDAIYREAGIKVWSWDGNGEIPELPPAVPGQLEINRNRIKGLESGFKIAVHSSGDQPEKKSIARRRRFKRRAR